jgi:hypothetical protein
VGCNANSLYHLLDIKNLPEKLNIQEIKKALQVMREMKFNEEEREFYKQHLDFFFVYGVDLHLNKIFLAITTTVPAFQLLIVFFYTHSITNLYNI